MNGLSWAEFKTAIASNYNVNLFIEPEPSLDKRIVFGQETELLLILKRNFKDQGYLITTYDRNYFITKGQRIKTELPVGFFNSRKNTSDDVNKSKQVENTINTTKSIFQKTYVIGTPTGNRSKKVKLSGRVSNSSDGLPIIGGTIYVSETQTGVATDANGHYLVELKPGKYNLVFNSLESLERNVSIELLGEGILDIKLDQNLFELQEVEISSSKTHNVKGVQLGFNKINAKKVKEIPLVLGEQDVLKVAMLLPGVTSVGEGTSGFNVRGSPTDQNLFYFSQIPVYNTSHAFGFFSAFNADAIESFNLYKGSIPVNFGGRLSSVFDIKSRKGHSGKFKARGGISPITARILVEGPVVKDKISYIAGFRSTYSNWVLKLVKDPEVNQSEVYFGDMILGLDAVLNEKNSLKVTGYGSYDNIKLADDTRFNYHNIGASVNWYHSFSTRSEMRLSYVHSEYYFSETNTEQEQTAYNRDYKLSSDAIDLGFSLTLNDKHTLSTGLSSLLYNLNRGSYRPYNEKSDLVPIVMGEERAIESAVYIGDEWRISPLLTIVGGIRYNFYSYLGPNTVFEYKPDAPKVSDNIKDTLSFGSNEIIKSYSAPDFRLSAIYLINPNLSIKASYNRLHQYIFLLTNTIAVSPSDTWKLADYNIKPMTGDQFTAGIYANLGANYEVSMEGYYKFVKNLVEYKDGADLVTSKHVEQDALQGDLNAYGIEFMLKKPFGKFTGWLNYSYSRSMVQVADNITGESINFGKQYASNYDRPHTLNLVANFNASKRISISGNLSYATGRPITYPTAIYYLDGKKILHYSERNEYRIPDYFRVDMALKIEGNLLSKKLGHSSFILSVYNLTGRKNAYSVYFKSENGRIKGYKMSIFGTQIYSITWDFKLGNYND